MLLLDVLPPRQIKAGSLRVTTDMSNLIPIQLPKPSNVEDLIAISRYESPDTVVCVNRAVPSTTAAGLKAWNLEQ